MDTLPKLDVPVAQGAVIALHIAFDLGLERYEVIRRVEEEEKIQFAGSSQVFVLIIVHNQAHARVGNPGLPESVQGNWGDIRDDSANYVGDTIQGNALSDNIISAKNRTRNCFANDDLAAGVIDIGFAERLSLQKTETENFPKAGIASLQVHFGYVFMRLGTEVEVASCKIKIWTGEDGHSFWSFEILGKFRSQTGPAHGI